MTTSFINNRIRLLAGIVGLYVGGWLGALVTVVQEALPWPEPLHAAVWRCRRSKRSVTWHGRADEISPEDEKDLHFEVLFARTTPRFAQRSRDVALALSPFLQCRLQIVCHCLGGTIMPPPINFHVANSCDLHRPRAKRATSIHIANSLQNNRLG